jgi:copper chaperone CopZ
MKYEKLGKASDGGESFCIMEFKLEGMTCSACSSAIEKAMNKEFGQKGMTKVEVALIMHKMTLVVSGTSTITPDDVIDEVVAIGFDVRICYIIFRPS